MDGICVPGQLYEAVEHMVNSLISQDGTDTGWTCLVWGELPQLMSERSVHSGACTCMHV